MICQEVSYADEYSEDIVYRSCYQHDVGVKYFSFFCKLRPWAAHNKTHRLGFIVLNIAVFFLRQIELTLAVTVSTNKTIASRCSV